MSNYPPGVTGNEPEITGEWPCSACDGVGGEPPDEPGGSGWKCWMCGGSGIHPEEAPSCPECGDDDTTFPSEWSPDEITAFFIEHENLGRHLIDSLVVCHHCGEISK